MKAEQRIEARVTPEQKRKIAQIAEKCGLPQSEYIRQRALGYEPRASLPEAFYGFYAKIIDLSNSVDGSNAEEDFLRLIDDIRAEFMLPVRRTTAQVAASLGRGKR